MTLKNIFRAQTRSFSLGVDDRSDSDDDVESEPNEGLSPSQNNLDEPLVPRKRRHKIYHIRGKMKTKSGNFTWIACFILAIVCVIGVLLITVNWLLYNTSSHDSHTSTAEDIIPANISEKHSVFKPCTNFTSLKIWHRTIAKLMTETAVRLNDVNLDNIDDILVGFMTALDGYFSDNPPKEACNIYFNGSFPCFGGVLALDGRTGRELWRHYTIHEVFAVNCNADIDFDGVRDCLIGGRVGVFEAISARRGTTLWKFTKDDPGYEEIMGIYTPQFVRDLDGDGVLDIVAAHGGDPLSEPNSEKRLVGKLFLFSGKTGQVLKWQNVPDKRETYFSPVVYSLSNGTDIVLFGTGGETHPGSLWAIDLIHLFHGRINKAVEVYSDDYKGVMVPPVLADINKDGTVDIIVAMFNASVVAFDGETYKIIWQHSFPGSETYSTPGAGYFNNDDVPDFFVRYNHGKGFPLYYYSEVAVLDGITGRPITDRFKNSVMSNASPLSISMTGLGNDLFVYWIADCVGHEGEGDWFDFVEGTNVHEQSRADTCKLRYKTKSFSRLLVMNRKTGFPGHILYDSLENERLEHASVLPDTHKDVTRVRRHVGPPDHGGFQRLIQTGSIAPTFESHDQRHAAKSIDVIMVTYWMYPAKVRVITDEQRECIEHYRNLSQQGKFDNKVNLTENFEQGNYDEGDAATNLCLKSNTSDETFYINQANYKYKSLQFGNLTVYRFRLTCLCEGLKQKETCSEFLPMDKQAWGGYMGTLGNSYFIGRGNYDLG